jgi:hypothetical protein
MVCKRWISCFISSSLSLAAGADSGAPRPRLRTDLAGLQARSGPTISCFKIACFIGFDPNRGTAGLAPWRRLRPRLLFSSPRVCRGRGRLYGAEGPRDYFKVRATIPAEEAFRPLSEGGCPLVNR